MGGLPWSGSAISCCSNFPKLQICTINSICFPLIKFQVSALLSEFPVSDSLETKKQTHTIKEDLMLLLLP